MNRPQLSALALILSLGILPSPAHADSRRPKLDRALVDALEAGSTTAKSVIIRTQPGQLTAVETRIKGHGHGDAIESRHTTINARSARVTAADLDVLAADPAVLSISSNAAVKGFANANAGGASGPDIIRATLGLTASSPKG